jgi:heme exporter protein C
MKTPVLIAIVVVVALLAFGLYQALVVAPTDQLQGDVYRIIYYHVPSAWTAFLLFFVNFCGSIWYLFRRGSVSDAIAVTTAEVGVVFCTIVLITGPIWARPVWGIWWTWDARLTSTLLLWLIYISYLILRRFSTGGQTPVLAASLAVFGFADVPFVYLSIRYFRTQHPQPVIGGGGKLDPGMLHIMLYNWLAFVALAALLCWFRYQLERKQKEVEETIALESMLEGSPR